MLSPIDGIAVIVGVCGATYGHFKAPDESAVSNTLLCFTSGAAAFYQGVMIYAICVDAAMLDKLVATNPTVVIGALIVGVVMSVRTVFGKR